MRVTLTIEEFEALARIAIDKLCEGFERCDSDQASRDMKLAYIRSRFHNTFHTSQFDGDTRAHLARLAYRWQGVEVIVGER